MNMNGNYFWVDILLSFYNVQNNLYDKKALMDIDFISWKPFLFTWFISVNYDSFVYDQWIVIKIVKSIIYVWAREFSNSLCHIL